MAYLCNMDPRLKILTGQQRVALARLVADTIISDKIIDDVEIAMFDRIFGSESSRGLFEAARHLPFAQALKILRCIPGTSSPPDPAPATLRRRIARNVTGIIAEVSRADGICAPQEAALQLAMNCYLEGNDDQEPVYDVVSSRLTDISIGHRYVLYADFSGSARSEEADKDFTVISGLLASVGFTFIHIPRIINEFTGKGREHFRRMARYMFPEIVPARVDEVYTRLSSVTTRSFITDYLNRRLGLGIDTGTPSLVVMAGTSSVASDSVSAPGMPVDTYANFLKIRLAGRRIVSVAAEFVEKFNSFTSYNLSFGFTRQPGRLPYYGIRKAFFRLVALSADTPETATISIDPASGTAAINGRRLNLSPARTALYVLIICLSATGAGLPLGAVYAALCQEKKERIQRLYETVYSFISNSASRRLRPLYPGVTNRLSEIRREIAAAAPAASLPQVQVSRGDHARVLIPVQNVTAGSQKITDHPLFAVFEKEEGH